MKRLLLLLPVLMFAACTTTSGIKTAKNTDAPQTTIAACDTCIEVRIKNTGVDDISGVEVENNHRESYYFTAVKAGEASEYQKFNSFCSCGYQVLATYFKTEENKVTLPFVCQNIMPCTDFLKGRITIEINTGKLPAELASIEVRKVKKEIQVRKD